MIAIEALIMPTNMDIPLISSSTKEGDIIWAYDSIEGMKIPMAIIKIFENGTWLGKIAWTWGLA